MRRSPSKRWLPWIILVAAVVGMLALQFGLFFLRTFNLNRDVEQVAAELAEQGYDFEFQPLDPAGRIDVGPRMAALTGFDGSFSQAVEGYFQGVVPIEEVRLEQTDVERAFAALDPLLKGDVALPTGPFDEPENWMYPHAAVARSASKESIARARLRAESGDLDGMIADLERSLALANLMSSDPSIIGEFVGVRVRYDVGAAALEVGREHAEMRGPLLRLLAEIEPQDPLPAVLQEMRFDRHFLRRIRLDPAFAASALGHDTGLGDDWFEDRRRLSDTVLLQAERRLLLGYQGMLEAYPDVAAMRDAQGEAWNGASEDVDFFRGLFLDLPDFVESVQGGDTYIQSVRVVLGEQGLLDRYGNPLQTDGETAWSLGADGLEGTEDDIFPLVGGR